MTKFSVSLVTFIGLVLSANAFAAPTATTSAKSEYFHQTAEGQQELTPAFEYRNATLKYKTNSAKTEMNGMQLKLQYERGLTSTFSIGGIASYASLNSKSTGTIGTNKNEAKGLEDLNFFARGFSDLQDGRTLWFGANLALSLGDHEYKEKPGDKSESNSFTGGHVLTPYIGYSVLVNNLTLGGKFSTELNIGEKTNKETDTSGDTTKTKESGGETHTISLFLETPMAQGIYGASLDYAGSNTTTQTSGGSSSESAGVNQGALKVYGTHAASETATLRGELSYGTVLSSVTNLKSSQFMTAQIAARFAF